MKHGKKKKAKVNSGTKGRYKQIKQSGKRKSNKRVVRRNKSGKSSGIKTLSQPEREIYREFESLLKADLYEERQLAKVPGAKVVKRKGRFHKNLFEIPLPHKGIDNKIRALRNADFSNIERYLNKQKTEPLYVYVTLKIKIPEDSNFTFEGKLSSASMVVNTVNTKEFAIETLIDYNNRAIDSIQSGSASGESNNGRVWNVVMLSIRFLFRKND